ncbi:DUF6891 domain-containing protein [Kitasatospora sp. NPDC096147]|uniref:DUF6891 domain-containing protein n=1 Tax=Kitasatospora sp. NPDC096147 TaxID=3364093 RepID=UPI0037F3BF72
MLEITVQTESGARHVRPTAGELAALVERIGADGDNFLVLERLPDRPEVFAQVWHRTGGDYTLEHRDGSNERHFESTVATAKAVTGALTGWARQSAGWDLGVDWARLALPPTPEVPPLDLPEADRATLEDRLRLELAVGYTDPARLAELAEEYLVTPGRRPVSPAQAAALARELWQERIAEQAGWQGETGPERLTRAFAALERSGVTAREHFTCCRSCGQAEIGGEAAPGSRGFVYFHSQSGEAAASGHGLTLHYGGFDGTAATTTAVGHEVVAALHAVGLRTVWDGTPERAVTVTPIDWRRRLVG